MPKIYLLPPILTAIYLVAMNWTGMYQAPDIIGIPVIFEIMAFVLFIIVVTPVYWLLVLPGSYISLKISGSRYGGLVLALILASVIPAFMSTLDYPDLSWRGTLSMSHVLLVIIPVLFLTIYGYHLLYKYLLERKEPQFKVWLSPASFRKIFIGLVILFISVIILGAYWNQKPVTANIVFLEQDKLIEDRVMIQAQIFVINTLLGKHGGLLRDDLLPPGMALDNIHHWERGVEKQINLFSQFIDGSIYIPKQKSKRFSGRTTQAKAPDIPDNIMQASINIQQAFNQFDKSEADSLYREAHDLLEQYNKKNDGSVLPSIHSRNFKRWLDKASVSMSKASARLEQDKENIDQALNPKRYSPRKPALLAIQPLWKETDALYEAYGAAWALSVYLKAIEIEFSDTFKYKNAFSILHQAQAALDNCQPSSWSPVLLSNNGIKKIQEEITIKQINIKEAMIALFELSNALKN